MNRQGDNIIIFDSIQIIKKSKFLSWIDFSKKIQHSIEAVNSMYDHESPKVRLWGCYNLIESQTWRSDSLEKGWIHVVYFDQQTGGADCIGWSKYTFHSFQLFGLISIWKRGKIRQKRAHNNYSQLLVNTQTLV